MTNYRRCRCCCWCSSSTQIDAKCRVVVFGQHSFFVFIYELLWLCRHVAVEDITNGESMCVSLRTRNICAADEETQQVATAH